MTIADNDRDPAETYLDELGATTWQLDVDDDAHDLEILMAKADAIARSRGQRIVVAYEHGRTIYRMRPDPWADPS